MENKPKAKISSNITTIISAIIFIGLIWFFFGGGLEKQAANDQQEIENQVVVDAEKEYEIAKSSGQAMDAYVHAGIVAAAYLQANDQVNYKKWKDIEEQEAKNAGVSME